MKNDHSGILLSSVAIFFPHNYTIVWLLISFFANIALFEPIVVQTSKFEVRTSFYKVWLKFSLVLNSIMDHYTINQFDFERFWPDENN